jgi:hypothetical protein
MRYDVGEKVGDDACPFNYLYWAFLHRHRERFGRNPRMAQMYRTWAKMSDERREAVLNSAETFLARLDAPPATRGSSGRPATTTCAAPISTGSTRCRGRSG